MSILQRYTGAQYRHSSYYLLGLYLYSRPTWKFDLPNSIIADFWSLSWLPLTNLQRAKYLLSLPNVQKHGSHRLRLLKAQGSSPLRKL